MCVTSFLCGPRADLWPFYGFLCKRFSGYIKVYTEKTVYIKTHKMAINGHKCKERRETAAVFAGTTISHFLVKPALNKLTSLQAPFFASINSAPICLLICCRQILNIV